MLRGCFWHSFHLVEQQEKNLCDEHKESLSDTVVSQNSFLWMMQIKWKLYQRVNIKTIKLLTGIGIL